MVGSPVAAHWIWGTLTASVFARTLISVVKQLWRREAGVDLIALCAMLGALLLGEYLAGAIIAVMLAGGAAMERFAVARARRELRALLERAPRIAHRRSSTDLVDLAIDAITIGDVLLVKPGEVVPADGVLTSETALVDESALTGESRPTLLQQGSLVRSGGSNTAAPFELRVTAPAAQSTYAGIVRLVRAAEQSKAPFVRLADRYALGFLGVTLALAAAAWFLSGSPTRALAVLVVATPCPLILAAPTAIMAGVSRAARQGIIVKGGGPLETLANLRVLLLDKTGTVTMARPKVIAVESFGASTPAQIVAWAASLEQLSVHPYASAILEEARRRGESVPFPSGVQERMGAGLSGLVDGRRVAVGQLSYVAPGAQSRAELRAISVRTSVEGLACAFVAVDGDVAGALLLQDPIRPEAPRAIRALRKLGVQRVYMVTGDHPDVADLVGDAIGVDRVFAERAPEEKVEVVRSVHAEGPTAMLGDGINDAPALSLADVGIAMGARGATAASEAADIVLMVDQLDGLVRATAIAQRTRAIARQSVFAGMGLSVLAMLFAGAGHIAPVMGAVLQEGIDLLVILNALRALGGPLPGATKMPQVKRLSRGLAMAHRSLSPHVADIASLATRLDTLRPQEALQQLASLRDLLERELLPHERDEQQTAYPVIRKILGHEDPTGPLIQTHQEIRRLARLFGRLVAQLPPEGPGAADLRDVRRLLYGLHAILTLHFAQEDELYALFQYA
ncbi:MAG: heavy metal translocating P-type ATPase [Myxococcales bacterium]